MALRLDHAALRQAVDELVLLEPRFVGVVDRHGLPPLRLAENSLESLLRIVTEQLISLAAAAAIWQRLEALLQPVSAANIRRTGFEQLRSAGLSGAKARCFLALADCHEDGRFDPVALLQADDFEARQALLKLPGIGPWTADIYLLTALGRADVFPAGDRALQLSAQQLFNLGQAPAARQLEELAGRWQPWRSVAARLLWSHYRGLRGLPQKVA